MLPIAGIMAQEPLSPVYPFAMEYNPKWTLLWAFQAPPGYERTPMSTMTDWTIWVTNLPLKPKNRSIAKWDRQIIGAADSINGIIDIGIASKNQKDADLPLQLAIQYLAARNQLYHFPVIVGEGDTVTFDRWLNGKYGTDGRGKVIYKKGDRREVSPKEFYRFLEFLFVQNENKTLLQNLEPVEEKDIRPGDLYIQFHKDDPDSTGHAAMIFDVCIDKEGEALLLAGWGGDPAHSLIVARPRKSRGKKWFSVEELKDHLSEYGDGRFYRFANIEKTTSQR
jgi:hypothetical protein